MTIHSTAQTGTQYWVRYRRRLSAFAVAVVLIGCVSTESSRKEPTPRQDFIEFRRIVV